MKFQSVCNRLLYLTGFLSAAMMPLRFTQDQARGRDQEPMHSRSCCADRSKVRFIAASAARFASRIHFRVLASGKNPSLNSSSQMYQYP